MVNVRCLACQVKYRVLAAKNNNLPECQAPIHAPKFPYRAPSPRKPRSYNRVTPNEQQTRACLPRSRCISVG
ncbi:hypothetical protein O3P69_002178 [Scylla paramamosain]|uniref:Uncharacterized protein n=1 Tax=Scylla paramamosain TaxID=85552 RepID=A0AAW0V6G3_SCYPA